MVFKGLPPLNVAPVAAASAYGTAMIFMMLAYAGWSDAATLSAELRAGARGIVLTLIGGMALVTVLYTLVNWAYLRVLGHAGLRGGARQRHAGRGRRVERRAASPPPRC